MSMVIAQALVKSGSPFAGMNPDDAAKFTLMGLMMGGGLLIALVSIITAAWRRTSESRAREESRREIAAYVAEGSMSVADAERLMSAGKRRGACSKDA